MSTDLMGLFSVVDVCISSAVECNGNGECIVMDNVALCSCYEGMNTKDLKYFKQDSEQYCGCLQLVILWINFYQCVFRIYWSQLRNST